MEKSEGGNITKGQTAAGRVVSWKRGRRLTIRMNSATWQKDSATMLDVTFRRAENATRITMSLDGVGEHFDGESREMIGWSVTTVSSRVVASLTTEKFAGWYMGRNARNPSGERAVGTYIDLVYHWPGS